MYIQQCDSIDCASALHQNERILEDNNNRTRKGCEIDDMYNNMMNLDETSLMRQSACLSGGSFVS